MQYIFGLKQKLNKKDSAYFLKRYASGQQCDDLKMTEHSVWKRANVNRILSGRFRTETKKCSLTIKVHN